MVKNIAKNRKAFHEYFILDKFEAGIALQGTEVKSLRNAKVNLKDSFARIDKGEIYLHNMHISPYEFGNISNHNPLRIRKLLLHKRQIKKLCAKISQQGQTIVPLSIYFNDKGIAKVELAIVKGKKLYDKRESIKKKSAEREMLRASRLKG